MPKALKFVIELVFVALVVGWILIKNPDALDQAIPWIILAILWYFTWEHLLQSDWVRPRAVVIGGKLGRMAWICAFLLGGLISILYWYGIKKELLKLTNHRSDSSGTTSSDGRSKVPALSSVPVEDLLLSHAGNIQKSSTASQIDKSGAALHQIGAFIDRGNHLLSRAKAEENYDQLNSARWEWFQDTRQWLGIHLSAAHENSFDIPFVPVQKPPQDISKQQSDLWIDVAKHVAVLKRFNKKITAYGLPTSSSPGSRCAYEVPVTTSAAQSITNRYGYGIRVSLRNVHGIFAFTDYRIWTKGNVKSLVVNAESRPSMGASFMGTNMPPNFVYLSIQSDIPAGTPVNIEIYSDEPIELDCVDETP